jgi:hypothetical protein
MTQLQEVELTKEKTTRIKEHGKMGRCMVQVKVSG